jgi:hypothetical protein
VVVVSHQRGSPDVTAAEAALQKDAAVRFVVVVWSARQR